MAMLTITEKKLLNRYEDHLALPKWIYLLIYGFSFVLFLIMIKVLAYLQYDNLTLSDIFRRRFWISLAPSLLGGSLFGLVMRLVIQDQFRKLKDKESLPG